MDPDFLRAWRRRAGVDVTPGVATVGCSSWLPIDAGTILAGGLAPVLPTELLMRSDGVGAEGPTKGGPLASTSAVPTGVT